MKMRVSNWTTLQRAVVSATSVCQNIHYTGEIVTKSLSRTRSISPDRTSAHGSISDSHISRFQLCHWDADQLPIVNLGILLDRASLCGNISDSHISNSTSCHWYADNLLLVVLSILHGKGSLCGSISSFNRSKLGSYEWDATMPIWAYKCINTHNVVVPAPSVHHDCPRAST